MRDRWLTVSNLWEENKSAVTKMNLLEQLDYYGKLSSQLAWRREPGDRQVRVVYTGWGAPTAAVLHEDDAIVDYKLFWIVCRDEREAHYLMAIINSDTLADAVNKYTTPNWSGKTRGLQKHLWKLPIPEFARVIHCITGCPKQGIWQRRAQLRNWPSYIRTAERSP